MSKRFTPGQTTATGCTQRPVPVICCLNTTTTPVNKVFNSSDATQCAASFFLWTAYRRPQNAYGYHPLPVMKTQLATIASSINTHITTSHLPKTTGINTSYFM